MSEVSYSKLCLRKTKLMQDDELSFTSFCFANIFPNTKVLVCFIVMYFDCGTYFYATISIILK